MCVWGGGEGKDVREVEDGDDGGKGWKEAKFSLRLIFFNKFAVFLESTKSFLITTRTEDLFFKIQFV